VDRSLAATAIVNALCARHRTPLELPLVSVSPARTAAATAAAAAHARTLLSGPITLIGELPIEDAPEPESESRARAPKAEKPDAGAEKKEPQTARFTFEPAVIAAALRSRTLGADGLEIY